MHQDQDQHDEARAEYEGMVQLKENSFGRTRLVDPYQTEGGIRPDGPDFLRERYERNHSSALHREANRLADAGRNDWPRLSQY